MRVFPLHPAAPYWSTPCARARACVYVRETGRLASLPCCTSPLGTRPSPAKVKVKGPRARQAAAANPISYESFTRAAGRTRREMRLESTVRRSSRFPLDCRRAAAALPPRALWARVRRDAPPNSASWLWRRNVTGLATGDVTSCDHNDTKTPSETNHVAAPEVHHFTVRFSFCLAVRTQRTRTIGLFLGSIYRKKRKRCREAAGGALRTLRNQDAEETRGRSLSLLRVKGEAGTALSRTRFRGDLFDGCGGNGTN